MPVKGNEILGAAYVCIYSLQRYCLGFMSDRSMSKTCKTLVSWLIGQSVGWLDGWLVDSFAGQSVRDYLNKEDTKAENLLSEWTIAPIEVNLLPCIANWFHCHLFDAAIQTWGGERHLFWDAPDMAHNYLGQCRMWFVEDGHATQVGDCSLFPLRKPHSPLRIDRERSNF